MKCWHPSVKLTLRKEGTFAMYKELYYQQYYLVILPITRNQWDLNVRCLPDKSDIP